MKLKSLKSVELKAVEIPKRITVPDFADSNKFSDRVFGAFCRINPDLPCMQDETFLKRVFTVLKAAGGDDYLEKAKQCKLSELVSKDPEIKKWRQWYATEKLRLAEWRKANKEEIAKRKAEFKDKYGYAIVDGVEEPLQSYAVEPEGFFFGRGDSPISGYWKFENTAADLRINSNSKNLPVVIYTGEDEEKLITDNFPWKVTWDPDSHFAAQYDIKIGIPNSDGTIKTIKAEKYKMIQFGATSSVKKEGQSKKYAAASELGKSYEKIIENVKKEFQKARSSNKIADLSTAIAVFMLFEKGIRIGSAKPTVNGTKGLLSLEWGKDVKRDGNKIKFNFYGKDSVKDTSSIETEYADVIEKGWSKYTKLFTDKASIKEYIGKLAPSVSDVFSPKLCRTAVAASVMLKALDEVVDKYKLTKESPEALKKLAFDEANMAVARRLNHQRGVNKVAEAKRNEANKLKEEAIKARVIKVKEMNAKKQERIKALKAAKKDGWKEKVAKIQEQMLKADERLAQSKRNLKFKEENGNITASTSKAAYIDPSIVADFCTRVDLKLEKVYTKSQIEQFSQFFGED